MNQPAPHPDWWKLHLRKARGEALAEQEAHFYEAELARQDQKASPLQMDLESLKKLRDQTLALARENETLRVRVTELGKKIRTIEQSLSLETRQMLGIED